jgi:NADH dehydrogenase FAD-containing subunit
MRFSLLMLLLTSKSGNCFRPSIFRFKALRHQLHSTLVQETDQISAENPLHVVIAGAGVGGLALANAFSKYPHVKTTVLEKTSKFKRFGGPIQLASNAMQVGERFLLFSSVPLQP